MNNSLIISDLSYLQSVKDSHLVVGGRVFADTATITKTGRGYAIADADAVAIGDTTYSNAQTKTTVRNSNGIEYSRANAKATAYAKTGNQIASSRDRNTSVSFYVTN